MPSLQDGELNGGPIPRISSGASFIPSLWEGEHGRVGFCGLPPPVVDWFRFQRLRVRHPPYGDFEFVHRIPHEHYRTPGLKIETGGTRHPAKVDKIRRASMDSFAPLIRWLPCPSICVTQFHLKIICKLRSSITSGVGGHTCGKFSIGRWCP